MLEMASRVADELIAAPHLENPSHRRIGRRPIPQHRFVPAQIGGEGSVQQQHRLRRGASQPEPLGTGQGEEVKGFPSIQADPSDGDRRQRGVCRGQVGTGIHDRSEQRKHHRKTNFGRKLANEAPRRKNANTFLPMRLALNAATIKPVPLLEKIRVAGRAGYHGIELWAVDLYEHVGRGGEISEVERALADHGLAVPCLIAARSWGETAGWEYRLALDEARRRFELAARIGAPLVVCTPPMERPGREGLAARYADLLQIGRETGVRAVLEYISFFASLNRVSDAVAVLDECGDPEGCLVLDAFHDWNHETTDNLRSVPLERIAHYHIDDAPAAPPRGSQRDPDRIMVGDGVIDLHSELALLKEKGYDRWISLELFNAEWWARDPLDTARIGIERMRAVCSEVGISC